MRVWLDVPYRDKDEAKSSGARWDPTVKRWYAPRPGIAALSRWEALPDVPDLLPGEDRSFGAGLFVDLVPSSCWFTNVRSCVDQRDWERLRRMVITRAGARCEVCARPESRPVQRRLEVHERWSYDAANQVQSLRRLICLCTDCHRTTHFGLAQIRGAEEEALAHLMSITGLSHSAAEHHVREAFTTWDHRSRTHWSLNLDILTDAGVTIVPPPDPATRSRLADETLEG